MLPGSLRRVTAATAATLSLAEPFVAAALGIGLLHERLSLPMAAGTLLLLGGLIVVSVRTAPADGAGHPAAAISRSSADHLDPQPD